MSNDSCWQTLGIEPTNDESVIKKAYAKQLKHNKPDKNPEGFRQLRAAYEQALEARYWYDFADEEYDDEFDNEFGDETNNAVSDEISEDINNHLNNSNPDKIAYDGDGIANTDNVYTHIETIDDRLLINEHSSHHHNDPADNDSPEIYNATLTDDTNADYQTIPNTAHWQQAWQHIVAKQTTSDTPSYSSLDQQLQQLLIEQLNELQQQPLDMQTEFEEDLLIWFSEQSIIFADSYQLAKSHFAWDKHLNEWQNFEYPWFHLSYIDRQYQQFTNFQTPGNWLKYLASYYPDVYQHWELKPNGEFRAPNRLIFMDIMHFPYKIQPLAIQLEALNNELQIYQQQESEQEFKISSNSSEMAVLTASYWLEHPQMQALNRWTFGWVIRPYDFIILATISIGVLMLICLLVNSQWQQPYFYDGIGVFLTIATTYLFWQFLIGFFAQPQRFFHKNHFAYGWLASSIMLYLVFYSLWIQLTADITASDMLYQHTATYLACHLAGFNLFLASNNQEENSVITFLTCNFSLLLLVAALILPVFTTIITSMTLIDEEAIAFSPIFWLLPVAPTLIIAAGERLTKIHSIFAFIDKIGYFFLGILAPWGVLLLSFIIYAYCVDILPDIHFGFTAIAILICFGIPLLVNYFMTLNKHFNT
ncbi:J domain-containing protein [Psychrobacter sp. I-STPA10]|uniref:J domain-containing protein n=1 Tax=Psychrobacter sp. I-STPA10 TaxID=2585769 RepID=UPI001E4CFB34|nr:J domain-containing protein [Psychrobacter sp. I-STPA10]